MYRTGTNKKKRREKMKIPVICIAVTAMLAVTTAAFAEGDADIYDKTNNSVSDPDAASYKTVLIQNSDNVPVYINQAAGSSFGASAEFFLKQSPQEGTYTIKYGDQSGYAMSKTFVVGVDPANAETKLDSIEDGGSSVNTDGSYNAGFVAYVGAEMQYRSVILKQNLDGVCMGYDIPFASNISGEGMVKVGVQINNIPKDVYDSGVEVYLSTKSVEEYTAENTGDQTGGMANEEIQ